MTSTTFGHEKCLDKWGAVQDISQVLSWYMMVVLQVGLYI